MKKIVCAGAIIILLIIAVSVLTFKNGDWTKIAEGTVNDFTLIAAPVSKYDEIKVRIVSDEMGIQTVLWEGSVPKDALAYKISLAENNIAYDLPLTIREDGIGCLPTDYPHELTLIVYGK